MCGPAAVVLPIIAGVVSAAGAVYGGLAANANSKYEAQVASQNAALERKAGEDAKARGAQEQMRRYRDVARAIGGQRAAMGANGLDLAFGSALDIQSGTLQTGYEDSAILGENTRREVQGYDINAANFVMQGRAARARGRQALIGSGFDAAGSLLGAASQATSAASGLAPPSGGTSAAGGSASTSVSRKGPVY